METLDCRARQCPHPVVETRKLLLADPNRPLTVLVGDEAARQNVSRMAAGMGFAVEVAPAEGGFALMLTPGPAAAKPASAPAAGGNTVVFVGADTMGSGSDELGRLLMKNFIFTLTELDPAPDAVYFVNAGVRLTTEGSEVLEGLNRLACQGADIASCGLCLDFFHLKEKLAVGRVTNMLDIAQTLKNAGRIIRP